MSVDVLFYSTIAYDLLCNTLPFINNKFHKKSIKSTRQNVQTYFETTRTAFFRHETASERSPKVSYKRTRGNSRTSSQRLFNTSHAFCRNLLRYSVWETAKSKRNRRRRARDCHRGMLYYNIMYRCDFLRARGFSEGFGVFERTCTRVRGSFVGRTTDGRERTLILSRQRICGCSREIAIAAFTVNDTYIYLYARVSRSGRESSKGFLRTDARHGSDSRLTFRNTYRMRDVPVGSKAAID